MKLTFLEAKVPLTKAYEKRPNGSYAGGSYPGVTFFTSHVEQIDSLESFSEAMKKHSSAGHCLLTNSLKQSITNESRAKLQVPDELRRWIMLDVDGFDVDSVEKFITNVLPAPFHSVSYIVQHSPSSGIKPGIRAHVFFLLEDAVPVRVVSTWLKWQNLATEQLRNQVTLSNSEYALNFKLDWVANNNGRIIYITAPQCVGFSDPVTDRISIVEKTYDQLSFNFGAVSIEKINRDYHALLAKLRGDAGLPVSSKKEYFRYKGDKTYLINELVQPGAITGYIEDNDYFMRCNLNGGDSDAYFYHRNYPQYLHNFKGEPSIPLELLDKHHYDTVAKPWADKLQEKNVQPFVFRDNSGDKYYIGKRCEDVVLRQPNTISALNKIDDYYAETGIAPPDPIPTWDRIFNPTLDSQYDAENKVFNTWSQTSIMANASRRHNPPAVIEKIIRHATGGDQESYDRFINWLAYIYQNRTKSGTAWILHGCPGTGKGLITQHIIPPIFGEDYCVTQQVRDLKQVFNGWMEQAIFVTIDEANTDDAGAESKQIVEALKLWITEKRLSIRHMQQVARMFLNYSNFIFTSNDFGVLPVRPGDRRFNVAPRQEMPLEITGAEVADMKQELAHFAGYLSGFNVDKQAAHIPMENAAKEAIMEFKLSSIEEFVRAIQAGDLMFFVDNWEMGVPSPETAQVDAVINDWIKAAKANTFSLVKTKSLLIVYSAMVSGRQVTPISKFKKNMQRHNMTPTRHRQENQRIMGWRVDWKLDHEDLVYLGAHIRAVKTDEEIESDLQAELASPLKR